MKCLASLLGLMALIPMLVGADVPPSPKDPLPPLTEAEIAEAERLADAIMREEMPQMAIPDEDRTRYVQVIETVRQVLAQGMIALRDRNQEEAGRLYVAARKSFNEIPREVGPALGEDYHKMAKAMLSWARILLELQTDEARDPTATMPDLDQVTEPGNDGATRPEVPPPSTRPKVDTTPGTDTPAFPASKTYPLENQVPPANGDPAGTKDVSKQ